MSEQNEYRTDGETIVRAIELANRLMQTIETMKADHEAELGRLEEQRDEWRREAERARIEAETLRKEVNRARGGRDHYFKAFTALHAELDNVAQALVGAIKRAAVHANHPNGGRDQIPETAITDPAIPSPRALLRRKTDLGGSGGGNGGGFAMFAAAQDGERAHA